MSKAAGERYLNKLLVPLLEKNKVYQTLKQDFREVLDTGIHVLDISEKSLKSNLAYMVDTNEGEYSAGYLEFIEVLKTKCKVFESQKEFYSAIRASKITKVLGASGAYIVDQAILVATNYTNIRSTITAACRDPRIRNNRYFGIVNRARTLDELKSQDYAIGENIASITEQEAGISAYRCKPPGQHTTARVRYFNEQGLEINKDTRDVIVRDLSVFDIGHTFQGSHAAARQSPLSSKFETAMKIRGNKNIQQLVRKALESLADIQASVEYTYTNTIPSKLLDGKGVIVLSLHVYNRNNEYARQEGAIYSKLISDMKNELIGSLTASQLAKIPGSNTLEEDIVEVVSNKITFALTGIKKSLKKHDIVAGKATTARSKSSAKVSSTDVSLADKIRNSAAPKLRDIKGRFTSLVSLQNLINNQLSETIQKNMGSGDRKDILNYRTGRFAASAKVERMSQSREGMITAFYTYMKYPYQTFEPGYAQGSPQTRNPKLLISKSIREIAATQVANRMRAVLT